MSNWIQTDGYQLEMVSRFTDLTQCTAEYLWDNFDMHYNCVDTLPCYHSDDWSLIISPMRDILMGGELSCWCFEWAVFDEDGDWYDSLADYCLGSPWEAFRKAMWCMNQHLAGTLGHEYYV